MSYVTALRVELRLLNVPPEPTELIEPTCSSDGIVFASVRRGLFSLRCGGSSAFGGRATYAVASRGRLGGATQNAVCSHASGACAPLNSVRSTFVPPCLHTTQNAAETPSNPLETPYLGGEHPPHTTRTPRDARPRPPARLQLPLLHER